ncbi:MAG: 2-oxo-4-hydroxy-4-carboxy-5-ureidoimidazoline decarboxylase [Gammaproteobacteria bacterium]|jgi:2-oxo-4-hydroxy-4-carboxy-5-ureidoimidazoline decarboxylase
MNIDLLNKLQPEEARNHLYHCLSCNDWVDGMLALMPFQNDDSLRVAAQRLFAELNEPHLLEAFDGHPKIGDVNSLKKKYAATQSMAGHEQSGVNVASDQVLLDLARGNAAYEERFGFIFIVCATGKSASEMLELLQTRLPNDRADELANAAAEQLKITLLRLEKIL